MHSAKRDFSTDSEMQPAIKQRSDEAVKVLRFLPSNKQASESGTIVDTISLDIQNNSRVILRSSGKRGADLGNKHG